MRKNFHVLYLVRVIDNMSFLRFYISLCFKYFLTLTFVFSLAACSVSQPEAELNNSELTSGIEQGDSSQKALKVSWSAPLKREDDSTLNLIEIAEYRVYYGVKTGNYNNVIVVDGNSTFEAEDSNVIEGTYYVAVTVVDSDGLESGYSQEIIVTI